MYKVIARFSDGDRLSYTGKFNYRWGYQVKWNPEWYADGSVRYTNDYSARGFSRTEEGAYRNAMAQANRNRDLGGTESIVEIVKVCSA